MQIQFQERRIYLDTCSVGRSLDNQEQDRIRRETEAVETIVDYFFTGELYWVTSETLAIEIANNPNLKKREVMSDSLNFAHETILVGSAEKFRVTELEVLGFKRFDALHIACAESGGTDALLTTDDKPCVKPLFSRENAQKIKRRTFMIPPITKLLIRIEQLEWDLAEVKKELEALQAPFMKSLTPEERASARSARVRAQNERRRSLRKKRDPAVKTLTAEELQQLSLEEGINPEDNLLSSAIIEEREKRNE